MSAAHLHRVPTAPQSAPAFSGAIFCTTAKHPRNRAYTARLYRGYIGIPLKHRRAFKEQFLRK
nr:MAG TPA: hypothetical protein [Caudoviricetes sp.]